jgi:translation initiation factor 1A
MYQTLIRNKKKGTKVVNNYTINLDYEEYGLAKKLLGNCRILVLCNSGEETVGIIRGNMRKFNKRVLIDVGDIVVVSKRDYQANKVDIVHKFSLEQCKTIINNKEITDTLINEYYKNVDKADINDNHIIFDDNANGANNDTDDNDIIAPQINNLRISKCASGTRAVPITNEYLGKYIISDDEDIEDSDDNVDIDDI